MPFAAFQCQATGDFVSPQSCIQCACHGALPGCHMTAPTLRGILSNMRPDDPGELAQALLSNRLGTSFGSPLSVTTVLSCPRKWRLKIEYDYGEKPSNLFWAFRGQIAHEIAAHYSDASQNLVEERLSFLAKPDVMPAEINSHVALSGDQVVISGQPDVVYLERGHLMDYKSTKAVPKTWKTYTCPNTGQILREGQWRPRRGYLFSCACGEDHKPRAIESIGPRRAYQGHIQQVSVYAYMLAENGVEINSAEIVYLDMMEQVRIPVDLISHAEIEKTLGERLCAFLQEDLPPPLKASGDKEPWECRFCPVRTHCETLAAGEAPPQIIPVEAISPQGESETPQEDVETRILAELGYGD